MAKSRSPVIDLGGFSPDLPNKSHNENEVGPKQMYHFKNRFCSGSFILLYFYLKLLVHFNFDIVKVSGEKYNNLKLPEQKTILEIIHLFWASL